MDTQHGNNSAAVEAVALSDVQIIGIPLKSSHWGPFWSFRLV